MKRVPLKSATSPAMNGGAKVPPSFRVNDGSNTRALDSLQNLVTGLGTSRDKTFGTQYVFNPLSKIQVETAFRSDWIARKIITIPAQDATREWRSWESDKADIGLLEDTEKKLIVQQKVKNAMLKARLYGGAGLLMGIDQGKVEEPLEVQKVGKDALKFLHVVSRYELTAGEMDWDINSEFYGLPKYYTRSGGVLSTRIHPSRVIRFNGNEIPDITMSDGWSDSILQAVNDAIVAAGMTLQNGAQLLNEIKMDIIKIPELSRNLARKSYAAALTERFGLANVTKSLYNILLLDTDEEWERITANMQGIPDTLKMYLLVASAAADIPATRMLGQSPAGMNATGESDIRNYYDHIKSEQTTTISPAMATLDEVLIRSSLGTTNPEDVIFRWNPLWQMDEAQKATIASSKATAFKVDVDTALIPSEVLRDARINQLLEDGTYPGLEQILEDYGDLDPVDEPIEPDPAANENVPQLDPVTGLPIPVDPAKTNQRPPLQASVGDMAKRVRRANLRNKKYRSLDGVLRTLYVYRPVLNTGDILKWAKTAGIPNLEASNQLHCTIMYSKTPVDWSKTGEAWGQDDDGTLTVRPGGMRALQKFGNAIVLCFNSSELGYRHCAIKENTGAVWGYAEYQPHITLAYLEGNEVYQWNEHDLAQLGGYSGEIQFGPEVFAEASNPYVRDSNGNPYWDGGPGSGPQGGSGRIAEAKEKVKAFMSGPAKEALGSVVEKLKDPENVKTLLAGAVNFALYHVVGADYGPDVEKAIHNEVHNFATNAKISVAMAKETMGKAVDKLTSMRQKQLSSRGKDAAMQDEEDEILVALRNVKKAIDNMEVPDEE